MNELQRQATQKMRESIENEKLREQVLQLNEQLAEASDRFAAIHWEMPKPGKERMLYD